MKLEIQHQDTYSKKELLLRSFFGVFYMIIPHLFLLTFHFLAAQIASIYSAFHILLHGTFPPTIFHYQEKVMFWAVRLHARAYNLCDAYPPIGLDVIDDKVFFEWDFPEQIDRKDVLKRFMFAWFYVFIPHFMLFLLQACVASFISIAAFFVILIKGQYPKKWHNFQVNTLAWLVRIFAYMWYIEHSYPSFFSKSNDA